MNVILFLDEQLVKKVRKIAVGHDAGGSDSQLLGNPSLLYLKFLMLADLPHNPAGAGDLLKGTMRLEFVFLPDPLYRRGTDLLRRRHRAHAPLRGVFPGSSSSGRLCGARGQSDG
jgi:hypothetical protein